VAFEDDPYQLLFAENGAQALALAQTERPEVVLLDIKLPGTIVRYLYQQYVQPPLLYAVYQCPFCPNAEAAQ
jgi:putative two-component system response regulator